MFFSVCIPQTRFHRAAILFCTLLLCLPFRADPALGQTMNRPTDARGWSNLVYAHYQSLKSLHAAFEQTITHKESGIEEQREGEFFFKKPFLVRWISQDPYPEQLIVEEKNLWQFLPAEKLALKFKIEALDDQSQFLSVLTGQVPLADKFKITPKEEREGVQAIALSPYSPSANLVEATIWVDMESGNILRLVFADFYGNLNDISFTNQELDIHIPSDTFKFVIPPGVAVEDYTSSR